MITKSNIVFFSFTRVYVLVCISVLLVSCRKSEILEEEDLYPISFASGMAETRADNHGLEQYADHFFVYGYKYKTGQSTGLTVFDGEKVQWTTNTAGTSTSNSSDWEYVANGQHIRYWDFSAEQYRFFATTAGEATSVDSLNNQVSWTFSGVDTSNEGSAPYFSHQWYSDNTSSYPAYASVVNLKFLQPFCKVSIKFIDEEGKQYTDTDVLLEIKFAPVQSDAGALITKGDFTVSYPIRGDVKDYTFSTSPTATIPYISEPYETGSNSFATSLEKWYTLLPPVTQGDYRLTAKLGREVSQIDVPASKMQWKPGVQYTYIFKVPADAGIFLVDVEQVSVQSWSDQVSDHPVYNW